MRINMRGRRAAGRTPVKNGSRVISPGITPLLIAANEGSDLIAVASSLAATYGLHGESLDRFVSDMEACLEVAGLSKASSAMLRAASIAWADAYAGHFEQLTCSHAATGLSSVHHLQAHVQRLSRHSLRLATLVAVQEPRHVLIVMDVPREHATRAAMTVANERLRARVLTAEVVAALSTNRSAALILASGDPLGIAGDLHHDLQDALAQFGAQPRVWVEALPTDRRRATNLVGELTR